MALKAAQVNASMTMLLMMLIMMVIMMIMLMMMKRTIMLLMLLLFAQANASLYPKSTQPRRDGKTRTTPTKTKGKRTQQLLQK